jgi:hypothetical protein
MVMEIPSEILGFVDVETKNVVHVKLAYNNVSCLALATGEDENHDWWFCCRGENKPWG